MGTTSLPFFGRAWKLALDTATGGHYVVRSLVGDGEEPLRISFSVECYALLAYWKAHITVYNLASGTANQISAGAPDMASLWKFNQPLVAGNTVSLSAGYQSAGASSFDADANLIYTGRVLQPIWTREGVVDYKLTLSCVTGLLEDALNFVSFPMAPGATAYDVLNQVCSQPQANLPIENIDSNSQQLLTQSTASRGQAIFGRPYEIIRQIAKQNSLMAWVGPRGLNVRSFNPADQLEAPDYSYGPPEGLGSSSTGTLQGLVKRTLIGMPEQTQDGVVFRVLLDSSVNIADIVQLAPGTLINPLPIQVGNLPPVPSRNGLYVVAGVRHVGDSRGRGDDWYTEITGLTMDFFANFLQGRNVNKPNTGAAA